MTEYKETLNLPTTSFPMKANLAQREPKMLVQWEQEKLYEKMKTRGEGRDVFVLHDGPPYANGHLHCGHALNKILKDIVNKSKTLSGFYTPFVPGWDCHGLPIELNVEKKMGKVGAKISAAEFRRKCREYAHSQLIIQREEFKRLGIFGDWQHPYITMDYSYEANVIRALGKIIENRHLQQGFKPVHWCVECKSALAEAEVEYEDKISSAIDVSFFVSNSKKLLSLIASDRGADLATDLATDRDTDRDTDLAIKPIIVPIWTTTPWTLPANEAVCLHPELEYSLVDIGKHYFLIATDLVTKVMSRYKIENYAIVGKGKGRRFDKIHLKHPFLEKEVPMICGEHVTVEAGTGCVHTAPAHGVEDYQIGLAYNLPLINPVDERGYYQKELPFFSGLSVLKDNEKIIAILKQQHCLLFEESVSHSYPHCWRHKVPMIFLTTPQWFIMMDQTNLRDAIINEINKVKWLPTWGKTRMTEMIKTRPDWCISRQRAWGTPMPLFVHKKTKILHPDTVALIEEIAVKIEQEGIEAWFALDIEAFLGKEAANYEKITDTLDVWFDSGVSHYCVLKQRAELTFPADVYLEGSDQYRGWFNSSLVTAVAIVGSSPYKAVLTHGYTVDAEGKKLSKSKGNYIALDKVVQQYGADILRLWVASTDYRHEVSISEEIIKRNADVYRRIRNTARFLLGNLFDFSPEKQVKPSEIVELDRWILKRAQQLQEGIIIDYHHYQFHAIYQKIHNFCALDLSSFYLDIIKDRQYTCGTQSVARRSCQTAMFHIIQALTRWLAPILSFTADEIWCHIPSQVTETVFLTEWYVEWPRLTEVDMDFWNQIHFIRNEVNKTIETERKKGLIGSSLAAEVVVYADENQFSLLKRISTELHFLFITSAVTLAPMIAKKNNSVFNEELGIAIDVVASEYSKCNRCWHRCKEVGSHASYPTLCNRCINTMNGQDEVRHFV